MLDDGLDDSNNLQGNCGHHLRDVPASTGQRQGQGRVTSRGSREARLAPWPREGPPDPKAADLGLRVGFLFGRALHLSEALSPLYRTDVTTEVLLIRDV